MPSTDIINEGLSFIHLQSSTITSSTGRFSQEGKTLAPVAICTSIRIRNSLAPRLMMMKRNTKNEEYSVITTKFFHFLAHQSGADTFLPYSTSLSLYADSISEVAQIIQETYGDKRYFLKRVTLCLMTHPVGVGKVNKSSGDRTVSDFLLQQNPLFESISFISCSDANNNIDSDKDKKSAATAKTTSSKTTATEDKQKQSSAAVVVAFPILFKILQRHPSEQVRFNICQEIRRHSSRYVHYLRGGGLDRRGNLIEVLSSSVLGTRPETRVTRFETASEYVYLLSIIVQLEVNKDENADSEDDDDYYYGRYQQNSFDTTSSACLRKLHLLFRVLEFILQKEHELDERKSGVGEERIPSRFLPIFKEFSSSSSSFTRSLTSGFYSRNLLSDFPEELATTTSSSFQKSELPFVHAVRVFVAECVGDTTRCYVYKRFLLWKAALHPSSSLTSSKVQLCYDEEQEREELKTQLQLDKRQYFAHLFHFIFGCPLFYAPSSTTFSASLCSTLLSTMLEELDGDTCIISSHIKTFFNIRGGDSESDTDSTIFSHENYLRQQVNEALIVEYKIVHRFIHGTMKQYYLTQKMKDSYHSRSKKDILEKEFSSISHMLKRFITSITSGYSYFNRHILNQASTSKAYHRKEASKNDDNTDEPSQSSSFSKQGAQLAFVNQFFDLEQRSSGKIDPETNFGFKVLRSLVQKIKTGFPKRGESQDWTPSAASDAESAITLVSRMVELVISLSSSSSSSSTTHTNIIKIKDIVDILVFHDEIFGVLAACFPKPPFKMSYNTTEDVFRLAAMLVEFYGSDNNTDDNVEQKQKTYQLVIESKLKPDVDKYGGNFISTLRKYAGAPDGDATTGSDNVGSLLNKLLKVLIEK